MAFDTYTTAQLIGAYGVIDRPKPFIYDTFFRSEILFETEQVFFDKVQRARRLAPIVAPTVQGKAEKLRGYQANSFTPAYVKPKHVLEPNRLLKRRPGEALLGSMSMEQRRDAIVLDTLQIEDDQITRREEYMATQLMLTGAVTVVGEDFPSQTVDMARPANNTIVLSGGTAWGATGVDPLTNLQTWAAQVQSVSGFSPTVVVMDPLAYQKFLRSASVNVVMNSFRQTMGNIDLAGTAVGGVGNEARYQGNIGQFDIWVYQQFYTDANGNVFAFMPNNTVIMADPIGCQGTRLYGAIQDMRVLTAASRFPKMWIQEDPSAEFMMTQSAPLPVLGWSEATLAATVA
jgi:hypothetical protein